MRFESIVLNIKIMATIWSQALRFTISQRIQRLQQSFTKRKFISSPLACQSNSTRRRHHLFSFKFVIVMRIHKHFANIVSVFHLDSRQKFFSTNTGPCLKKNIVWLLSRWTKAQIQAVTQQIRFVFFWWWCVIDFYNAFDSHDTCIGIVCKLIWVI